MTTPTTKCPVWCDGTTGHQAPVGLDAPVPRDEYHFGADSTVYLSLEPCCEMVDAPPEADYLQVYLCRSAADLDTPPVVLLCRGEDAGVRLTRDEAVNLAVALFKATAPLFPEVTPAH